jgi:putative transposase
MRALELNSERLVLSRNSIDANRAPIPAITDRISDLATVGSGESASGSLHRMPPLSHPLRFVLIALAGWMHQQQRDVIDYLQEENRILREQLAPRRLRFTDAQRRRLAAKAKTLGGRVLRDIATIVTPDTLLAWHRTLIAKKYDGSTRRGPGRPPVSGEIRALIVRMASDNSSWGYTRIQGALANLDHHVSRGTIASILREHGLGPAPERVRKTTWTEFLNTHWDVLAATDFFTIDVWTGRGLTRFAVLFIIDLATRRVEIAGIAPEPDSAWMAQVSRNVTDASDGFLTGKRYLIHDRDPLFTETFRETLAAVGVQVVRLPPRSPNLNAYAERFVRTIKESCLDRLILIGDASLHRAVAEFIAHYHRERNHQGLGNQLIVPVPPRPIDDGRILSRERLGGLLTYYHRPAA